jgi:DNA repair protein RecN (Recombination protein N)
MKILKDLNNQKLNLKEFTLKNFATFEDQIIHFESSFNAIIGETGSGKSLILDALQLILGSRADRKLVRKECEFATIEASFKCGDKKIKDYFNDIGYPFDEQEIIIKRIIYSSGKSKSFLNFQSCSLGILQNFSKRFIDLVGQFENQKLLSEKYQLVLLDNFSQNQKLIDRYQSSFLLLKSVREKIEETEKRRSEMAQRFDYINFQLEEIEKLNPSIEDEKELLKNKKNIMNFEDKSKFISSVQFIFESDQGLTSLLSSLEKEINGASNYITPEIHSLFENAKESLNEINYKLSSNNEDDHLEIDLDSVVERLDSYQKLKRKFSTDTKGLIDIWNELLIEKKSLRNIDDNLSELESKMFVINKDCFEIANQLHAKRDESAKKLSKDLTKAVRALRMTGSTLKISVAKIKELSISGCSLISFMAETNPGEGFYKVKDAASGGELSRILLAIRQILSSKDTINIFLFDEIDTGIGGETALNIGEALAKVSKNSQVIAITHLPQIAKYSDRLIVVSKDIKYRNNQSRTYSKVKELSGNQINDEVIQMTPLN